MTTPDRPDRPLYPVDRSFVLRLRDDDSRADALAGQVEHVASGHAGSFESVAELIRFIDESIVTAADDPRASPRRQARPVDSGTGTTPALSAPATKGR